MFARWRSQDPILYKGGANLYEYAWDNPTNASDPSGELCKVAVRCWTIVRWEVRLPFTHCGLTIETDEGVTTIDGSGGDVIQLNTGDSGPNTRVGTSTCFPDSTCECLLGYIPKFNAPKMPREHLHGNSNWALNCLVSHCGLNLGWGEGGAMNKPIGYDSPPCKKYGWVSVSCPGPGCSGASVYVCVAYYACP